MSYEWEKKQLRLLDKKSKLNIIEDIKETELELLARLHRHHRWSVVHTFNVASDCVYVGRALGLNQKELTKLKMAALLHDVGKLNMELIVLDQGIDIHEQLEILGKLGRNPRGNPLTQFTMRELVEYRSRLPIWNMKRISLASKADILERLGSEAGITVLEHIRKHQYYTEKHLLDAGTDPAIVKYASSHHPEYFIEPINKIEVSILSVVDKFNAMIHSEGIRNYTDVLGRSEALNILVEKFKEPRRIVRILAGKHVPLEEQEILSIHMDMARAIKKTIIERIVELIKLDSLVGGVLRKRKSLEKMRDELELAYAHA